MTPEKLNELPKEALVLLCQQQLTLLQTLKSQNEELLKRLKNLEEQLFLLTQQRFGRKSEKAAAIEGQLSIDFEKYCVINEAEVLTEHGEPDEPETKRVLSRRPAHYKKRDLSGYETEVVPAVEIPEEELKELFPQGYRRLEDEVYHELEVIPAQFLVKEYHVAVYVSLPDAEGNTEFARGPHRHGRLFGSGSLCSPTLLSSVINGKYGNANPLNRISQALYAKDVDLSPQDLAGWCIKAAKRYFRPLYDRMHRVMVEKAKLIHADESFFKLTEDMKERGPNAKSFMWLYHTDERYGSHPIFLYEYCPGRGAENPERFLKGYGGILLTDGYSAYHVIDKDIGNPIRVAGCWAHAKRRFSNLLKAVPEKRAKGTVAYEANTRIQAIYHVDNLYKDLDPEERQQKRQANVKPLVEAFFGYLKTVRPELDAGSETGKAVSYCLNQEKYLREFLNSGIIPLDNNDAERSIRAFCVNRANWHVINSKKGAEASGILLSMTETAKANGLKTFEYLTYVLEQMRDYALAHRQTPTGMEFDDDFLSSLLPWSETIPEHCRMKLKREN